MDRASRRGRAPGRLSPAGRSRAARLLHAGPLKRRRAAPDRIRRIRELLAHHRVVSTREQSADREAPGQGLFELGVVLLSLVNVVRRAGCRLQTRQLPLLPAPRTSAKISPIRGCGRESVKFSRCSVQLLCLVRSSRRTKCRRIVRRITGSRPRVPRRVRVTSGQVRSPRVLRRFELPLPTNSPLVARRRRHPGTVSAIPCPMRYRCARRSVTGDVYLPVRADRR